MSWNKTIYTLDERATKHAQETLELFSKNYPEEAKGFKQPEFVKGFLCDETLDEELSKSNSAKIDKICRDFKKGWFYKGEKLPRSKPFYGRIHSFDGSVDDYYVKTTKKGYQFLDNSFKDFLQTPIQGVVWHPEAADNIEDISCFVIVVDDNTIINFWKYCRFNMVYPVYLTSKQEFEDMMSKQ